MAIIAAIAGVILLARYIAERRKTQRARRRGQQSLRALADCANDGVLVNCEDRIVLVNQRMSKLISFDRERLIGMSVSQLIANSVSPSPLCRYLSACPECRLPWPIKDVFRSRYGTDVPVEVSAARGWWDGREATVLIVRDISTQVSAEKRARESDELLREVTDNIHEVFFMRDLEKNRMIYVSPAYAKIWGRPVEHFYDYHLDFLASVHPEDRSRVMAGVLGQKHGELFHGEYRILRPDGQIRWIRSRTFPVRNDRGELYRIAGIAEDVTERKLAEEALRASERQLRQIVDLVPHRIFAKDEFGRFLLVNEAVARFYGKSIEEIEGTLQNSLHDDDDELNAMQAADLEVIETGRSKHIAKEVVRDHDGELHVYETIKIPYTAPDGTYRAVIGVATDITARTEAERALRASESKYRLLVEHASDAILLGNTNGHIYDCNRRAEDLLGYGRDEIQNLYVTDLYPPENMEVIHESFARLETEEVVLIEVTAMRKDGTMFTAEVNSTLIRFGDSVWVHSIIRDITARKEAETQRLMQAKAQRDTLVREVHHRIKNNLQGVAGLLRQHATRNPVAKDAFDAAVTQVHTVAFVHGLQGQLRGSGVVLCEMTLAIAKAASGVTGRAIEPLVELGIEAPIYVREDEAVPLALVLNELLFNAIKHSSEDGAPVNVGIYEVGVEAHIKIRNYGACLPEGFDFTSGVGLGTGLRLVRSLLPPRGVVMTLQETGSCVICELALSEPVVELPRKRAGDSQGRNVYRKVQQLLKQINS